MKRRHLVLSGLLPAGAAAAPTEAQRRWLAAQPPLRFAAERDYGPFVFRSPDRRTRGLSIDMLDALRDTTGLRTEDLAPQTLAEILDGLRAGTVDFTSSLRPTPERAAFLDFTRPYVEAPTVLAAMADAPPRALTARAGERIAVGRGYAVEAFVRQRFPAVDWVPTASDTEAVEGVVAGRYQAAVLDIASLAFTTTTLRLPALAVGERIGFDYALAFGVRKGLPELVGVLDAGLAALPRSRREAILERWLGPYADVLRPPDSRLGWRFGAALVAAGGALGGAALWRARRARPGRHGSA